MYITSLFLNIQQLEELLNLVFLLILQGLIYKISATSSIVQKVHFFKKHGTRNFTNPFQNNARVFHGCLEHGGGGGSSKFNGRGGLSQYMGGNEGLKMLLKNTCEGVHRLVKLPPISLQACKSTQCGLLHTYFSRILARL